MITVKLIVLQFGVLGVCLLLTQQNEWSLTLVPISSAIVSEYLIYNRHKHFRHRIISYRIGIEDAGFEASMSTSSYHTTIQLLIS